MAYRLIPFVLTLLAVFAPGGPATAGPAVCDVNNTFDNVSLDVLDLNADAIAYAVLQYAMNTQAVNGEKDKGNFKPNAGAASPERLGPLFLR
jgi:hypothetical protein